MNTNDTFDRDDPARGLSYLRGMLGNYTVVAFRNMLRHKTISFINIFGLGIGIACCILAVAFVRYHLSWDTREPNADRIYKVLWVTPSQNHVGDTSGPLAPALKETFPEVAASVRMDHGGAWVTTPSSVYKASICVTDATIFDVFDYTLLQGNKRSVFEAPLSIVITASAAGRWFGTQDVVGKTLPLESYLLNGDYTITGVLKDPPLNTSGPLRSFNLLSTTKIGPASARSKSRREESNGSWNVWKLTGGRWKDTFVRLRTPEDARSLAEKLPAFIADKFGADAATKHAYRLQPLKDIHLYGARYGLKSTEGDVKSIYLVGGIAGLILLVACVNFVNLSTAHAGLRQKEIGVRKTTGAGRRDLFLQFTFESLLTTTLATGIGIGLAVVAIPTFEEHSGLALPDLWVGADISFVPAILFAVALLAGAYPAFVLSSFHPVRALTSKISEPGRGLSRRGLIAFQFVTCILLIVSTLVMQKQTRYLMSKELGFDRDLIVMMPIFRQDRARKADYGKHLSYRWRRLKEAVLEHPDIVAAAAFAKPPGLMTSGDSKLVQAGEKRTQIPLIKCGESFLSLFDIQLTRGRDFNAETSVRVVTRRIENHEFILNETAVRQLGWDNPDSGPGPIGKTFTIPGQWHPKGTVVGVVKDFHSRDLREPIGPLAIFYSLHSVSYLGVKIKPERIEETIAFLESVWNEFLPERPFVYEFLDEQIDLKYKQEMQTVTLMNDFSILGILLGCMGLFGLTSFTVERRVKEIGIRKTLGATVLDVVYRLSRESGFVLIASNVVAWPIGFYLLQEWLNQFVYRIDLHIGYFAISGGAAAIVALVTVALQAVPAARANPVESLRHE